MKKKITKEDMDKVVKILRREESEFRRKQKNHKEHTEYHWWSLFCEKCYKRCVKEFLKSAQQL